MEETAVKGLQQQHGQCTSIMACQNEKVKYLLSQHSVTIMRSRYLRILQLFVLIPEDESVSASVRGFLSEEDFALPSRRERVAVNMSCVQR